MYHASLPANQASGEIYALGYSRWKREVVRLCFPGWCVHFIDSIERVPANSTLLVWGMRELSDKAAHGIRVLRMEDGFLRSVGLGTELVRPLSVVIDSRGMYFDPSRPSDLEVLLSETTFTEDMLQRAAALRQHIVRLGLTKYNVGQGTWYRPPGIRRVILVPGQVESDASIAYGAPGIRTNYDLLRAAREHDPDAFILYKPHPDVVAGLRAKGTSEPDNFRWYDAMVSDVPMAALLKEVDEVHVMTSLSGFEALLRGKQVICYGQPFYAGWGLTVDRCPIPRRVRRLSIDELVVGTLLLYPRYISLSRKSLVEAETVIRELARRRRTCPAIPGWLSGVYRAVLRLAVGVR